MTKLADFIDSLDEPGRPSPGFWIDPVTRLPSLDPPGPPDTPLYLAWNSFALHPELLNDIELSPAFVEDWLPSLPAPFHKVLSAVKNYFSAGLLIGPKDSQIGLHADILHTHAYLAQLVGRKRCMLFSPADTAAIYRGKIDPDRPDLEKFPLFRSATAFESVLEPGEVLFIPSGWWHHVVALEKSITVNYNFFNSVNFAAYLTDVLRELPAILPALEALPESKKDLGID
ncbi:MAG: cupin-like domain-containing protein [Bryobacteraceae bacterium]